MLPDYVTHERAIGLDFYEADPNLRSLLDRHLPDPNERELAERLVCAYGAAVGTKIAPRAEATDKHGPVLRAFDEWGQPANEIVHNGSWLANKADLKRLGLCGLDRYAGRPVPGVVSAAVFYLVCQAETALMCALGMTSGAADIAERYAPPDVRDEITRRLRSSDPEESWEGGMFLTERQGGSDVGANTMRAMRDGAEWRLFGDKHFCSNVDADLFVVLARPDGAPTGTKGLATFLVPRRSFDGEDNHFTIKRLKPKLGTVGVPTGEVHMEGALAWLCAPYPASTVPTNGGGGAGSAAGVSAVEAAASALVQAASVAERDRPDDPEAIADQARDGKGLNRMMEMVNGSRFGVALMGLGIHRRSFLEAAIYAAHRSQFGNRIDSYPLVKETLVDLVVELEAGLTLTFECATAARGGLSWEDAARLRRILIPLAKMRATRAGLQAASAGLEVFGGNGYMEDWPMARQLRDAQCHPIWEGTENIICNDVRRAMRSVRAHEAVFARTEACLGPAADVDVLKASAALVAHGLDELRRAVAHVEHTYEDEALLQARRIAEYMADVIEGALLVEDAKWHLDRDGDARKAVIAHRFTQRRLRQDRLADITGQDRSAIDLFEPIIRYGRIEAADALAAVG